MRSSTIRRINRQPRKSVYSDLCRRLGPQSRCVITSPSSTGVSWTPSLLAWASLPSRTRSGRGIRSLRGEHGCVYLIAAFCADCVERISNAQMTFGAPFEGSTCFAWETQDLASCLCRKDVTCDVESIRSDRRHTCLMNNFFVPIARGVGRTIPSPPKTCGGSCATTTKARSSI